MPGLVKDDGRCFVCGERNPHGLRIPFSIDVERRRAEGRTRIADDFQGWQGITHGGIIAALLDEVCMHACRTLGDQLVTAEITVRYREPVPTGCEVFLVGEVTGSERRLVVARGRIEIDGRVAAEAEVRVVRLKKNPDKTP